MKKVFLFVLALLFMPVIAHAQTCYAVTPSGAGAANGTSWSNAYPGSILSSPVRGAIYYLADGNYSSFTFSAAASGTTTIEFRKAQTYDNGSSCSPSIAAGWSAGTMGAAQAHFGRGISIASSYFIFNGNGTQTTAGCGGGGSSSTSGSLATISALPPNPADCGMVIDDTACTSSCVGVYHTSSGPFTFEYIEFRANSTPSANEDNFLFGGGSSPSTYIHIFGHNTGADYFQYGCNQRTVKYSYFWGTEVQGVLADGEHGQYSYCGSGDSNGLEAYNIYRDITGSTVLTFAFPDNTENGWTLYGNVFYNSDNFTPGSGLTLGTVTDGVLACFNSGSVCTNLTFVQNTIVYKGYTSGVEVDDTTSGGSATIENNLWYSTWGFSGSLSPPSFSGLATIVQQYNSVVGSGTGCASGTANVCDSAGPNPFVNWQSGNMNLASENADWTNRLAISTPTVDPNGTPYTTDRGAFQFGTSSGTVTLTPSSQTFTSAYVGIASSPTYSFTLNNTTSSTDTGIAVSFTGTNPGDYTRTGGSCSTSLTASNNCTIIVTFTPAAAGSRTATLSVAGSAPGSPQTAALTGTGLASSVSITPTTLAFGNVLQSSPTSVMNATITNNSGGSITIGAITFTGTNGSDFTRSGGSPGTCSTTLANLATCTIGVVFTPTGSPVDNETATMNVAYTGFTGSPVTESLTGTSVATAPPAAPTGLTCTAS
jgi:hypothetical protein